MLSSTACPDYSGKSRFAGKTLFQTLFFFLLVTQICFAQWVQLGLEDKAIGEIAARNSTIFAVTTDSAVYRSTDNGITWSQIVDSFAVDIAIAPTGSLFMITKDSLYKSSNNGNTWVNLNVQLFNYEFLTNVTVSPAGFVFCGSQFKSWLPRTDDPPPVSWTRFILSTDDGSTWTLQDTINGGDLFDFRDQCVITSGWWRFGEYGSALVYLSSDNGQNWLKLGNTPWWQIVDCNVLSMCLNGNILIGGSFWPPLGLFISSDSCNTWTQVSSLIPIAGLSIESGGMLVGSDSLGVFLFSDDGDSLGSFNEGLTDLKTHTLSIDNNGYVYLGTDNGVWRRPLSEIIPVELISFTATTNGKEVVLNWSTATELNNQGFEIERSKDNISFDKIGFVPGFGTTTEPKSYSYSDQSAISGTNYYRLKQVDYDGSFDYSDVVEVDYRGFNSYLLEQNYPNPFNPTTTIGFGIQNKSNVKITILNAIGEEVALLLNEEKEPGFHHVEFYAMNLPSGVYFYQLRAGDFVQVKKMLLLK